jgi:predicted short-subunit dehydrogenase-like oxidoreductase (DUF2520 family)
VTRSTTVAIVGAGRVGTALGVLLTRSGRRVVAASGREASRERVARHLPEAGFVDHATAAAAADTVIVGLSDDRIEPVCRQIAEAGGFREGQTVLHLSGSVPLGALAPAREHGARTLSLHPLQTFPDVDRAVRRFPGSAVAVTAIDEEGYRTGESLAAEVGGRPLRLPDERKPLYHAAAVFCSSYLAVVEGLAERLFDAAGVGDPRRAMAPLAEATLANVLRLGGAAAVTGPTARGDAGTIARNLEALAAEAPDAIAAYVALAGAALDIGEGSGRLGHEERARVEEVLDRWR